MDKKLELVTRIQQIIEILHKLNTIKPDGLFVAAIVTTELPDQMSHRVRACPGLG